MNVIIKLVLAIKILTLWLNENEKKLLHRGLNIKKKTTCPSKLITDNLLQKAFHLPHPTDLNRTSLIEFTSNNHIEANSCGYLPSIN